MASTAPAKLNGQTPPSTAKRQAAERAKSAPAEFTGPFVRSFATADAFVAGQTRNALRAEIAGRSAGEVAAIEAAIERRQAAKAEAKASK